MNSEYINPFIQGAQNILNMICMEPTELGKLFTKKPPYISEQVAIIIGLTGQITGNVIFTMQYNVACSIASKMMMGMPVSELDAMSSSAISELANMISGNVATLFASNGIVLDITPPKFMVNATYESFSSVSKKSLIICVPLMFSSGSVFEIDISID